MHKSVPRKVLEGVYRRSVVSRWLAIDFPRRIGGRLPTEIRALVFYSCGTVNY